MSQTLAITFVALVLERIIGYPQFIHKLIGHPVEWMGRFLAFIDSEINRVPASRWYGRIKGMVALVTLLAFTLIAALGLAMALRWFRHGWLLEAVIATSLLAQKDLHRRVDDVARGLHEGLAQGRDAVRHIVGRDAEELDQSAVARAALESLAENTSDAIVAPALWCAIFGLPGIAVYKAINTADSMIGHKSERYIHFGWAAARLDDLVNLPASRLTGLLFAAAASLTHPSRGAAAIEFMMRDARKHSSPNSGWPEAALAGALDVRLGGPRSYGGVKTNLPWFGRGRIILYPHHITEGQRLQGRAMMIFAFLVGLAAIFSP